MIRVVLPAHLRTLARVADREVRVVDALPRNAMGKVQKALLAPNDQR